MKGILLAGGSGTRLYPLTYGISKQALPVYDKPMIYYPLSVLMLAGIRDILIITTPHDLEIFKKILGDGQQWGVNFTYAIQPTPGGIAQSLLIGRDFLEGQGCCLILGDNIFHGSTFIEMLQKAIQIKNGAVVFAYQVHNPEQYGVVGFDSNNKPINLVEKPKNPPSNYAVTGLYVYDGNAPKIAETLKVSARNELEITCLNRAYLEKDLLEVIKLGRGTAWLDTGTPDALLEASTFIHTIEKRQGLKIACPEEIAWRQKWINKDQLEDCFKRNKNSDYGQYIQAILQDYIK